MALLDKSGFAKSLGLSDDNPNLDKLYAQAQKAENNPLNGPLKVGPYGQTSGGGWITDQESQKLLADAKKSQSDLDAAKLAPPQTDPRYAAALKQSQDIAKQFRNNIPSLATSFDAQIAENQKKQLAVEIQNNTENYNARGLLYSTAREGANAASQQTAAQNTAKGAADVNTQLSGEANQLDTNAANLGMSIAGMNQQIGNTSTEINGKLLDLSLKNQAAQAQGFSDIGKGLGGAAGFLTGLGGKNSTDASTISPDKSSFAGQYQSAPIFNDPSSGMGTGTTPQFGRMTRPYA